MNVKLKIANALVFRQDSLKKRQNNEKNRWKRVENDENLSLIWKNKPNLPCGQIGLYSIITSGYGKYIELDTWWKQTQFKPKQSQFISAQSSAFSVRNPKNSGQRQDEEKGFEKTKPICFVLSIAWCVLRKGIWKNKTKTGHWPETLSTKS